MTFLNQLQRFLFFISCTILWCFSLYAQSTSIKIYNLEEDNRAVKINVLFKNHQGYIYAGTNNGLYKFDGTKFYRIGFENQDYTDTVTAIFQDRNYKYWIGFKGGRIANIINGKLTYFNPEEGTPTQPITAFLQDKQNKIWFSTSGEGIYYLKDNRVYLINDEDGLTDNTVSGMVMNKDGDILAATDQGINCIQTSNNNKITAIGPRQGLPDYIVSAITPVSTNAYIIGMQDKGYCLLNYFNGVTDIIPPEEQWKYGQINTLLYAQKHLWIATQANGVFKVNMSRGKPYIPEKIASYNNITSILEDNHGNIWLSDPATGLIRTIGESVKTYPLHEGTVFEHIHVLLADNERNIWVTNSNNELLKKKITNPDAKSTRLKIDGITEKTDITSLYQDMNNNIWVGTMGKGIFIVDPRTGKYRAVIENADFINASILSITGNETSVFISSLQGAMFFELLPVNVNITQPYKYTNFDQAGIGSNYIYNIYKDSKGSIWFATDGKGISVLRNGKFTNYGSADYIKDDRVYSITEDRSGNIWFSTASAGIYKYDGRTFRNYSVRDGLSGLDISSVKTDKKGNIAIIHKKGIDILDPVTNNISYINDNKGVSGLNVEDLGAVAQDYLGNIYLSSENGIVLYSPEVNLVQQPKTIIESVQLFLNVLYDTTEKVFSHDDNNFTFSYTGLYYTDPAEVYYQYKLEGFDSSWIMTKDRSKTFPKLAPGKYTFRIQSSLNKNFSNADEASWSFEIRQAIYKTWWFILICFLTAAAVLYWYIKNREAGLKKMERLRQEKIQFRFEVLRNQVNPHFLFNSFNTLISTIEDDPKMAVEYVEQLSDFFRNIVNYRDKDVITLKEEMQLLETYLFLQKKRYGNNLQLSIRISEEEKHNIYIPPLSLQLLTENAIKHNSITKDTPLLINIEIQGICLVVRNNINRRLSKETGAGMGLQNIINRYNILSDKEVKVTDSGTDFIVSLPLIYIRNNA